MKQSADDKKIGVKK